MTGPEERLNRTTLDRIAERIDYGFTESAKSEEVGPKFLRITDIQEGSVDWDSVPHCRASEDDIRNYSLRPGDIVFARTGATTGKSYLIRECPQDALFASYLIRVRPKREIDPSYLAHYFTSSEYWGQIKQQTVGSGQPGVNSTRLRTLSVPVPPFGEQQRIAAILDKADGIRRKREEGVRLTEELPRSTFLDMFGDPGTNLKGWDKVGFATVLKAGMRNGISPSSDGTVAGKVLILSAITGAAFDEAQVKEGRFPSTFAHDQFVSSHDFLICRGNGNKSLVGCGRFPTISFRDTVFPDTMIAASIDQSRLAPLYLERLWATPFVRRQIERGARTTNGTFKINQKVLAGIEIPVPPMTEQMRFADFAEKARSLRRTMLTNLCGDLFDSLVQHAFGGEL